MNERSIIMNSLSIYYILVLMDLVVGESVCVYSRIYYLMNKSVSLIIDLIFVCKSDPSVFDLILMSAVILSIFSCMWLQAWSHIDFRHFLTGHIVGRGINSVQFVSNFVHQILLLFLHLLICGRHCSLWFLGRERWVIVHITGSAKVRKPFDESIPQIRENVIIVTCLHHSI